MTAVILNPRVADVFHNKYAYIVSVGVLGDY